MLFRLAAGAEPTLVSAVTSNARSIDSDCDALAVHLRRDAGVLEQAREERDRMRPTANVDAWRDLLLAGQSAVVAVLTSRDPDVRGLKADNPFLRLGLIDEGARLALVGNGHAG